MSSVQSISRLAGWVLALAIIVLSIVPAQDRPVTPVPHDFEHLGIFVLTGMAFGIGYGRYLFPVIASIAFAAGVELIQIHIPDRHARLSDFIVDAAGISLGVLLGALVARYRRVSAR